ncbi:MAG: response regulator [Symbiobacteriaceae bacterium]|nr:response regulator [Symbiobacteriaceae bacterium]
METQSRSEILIVDDDKANLMYLNNLLSDESTLHMARDGMQALKLVDEFTPDLILLDILMPGMNGYEVLSELKKSERTRNIPVIFITGLGTDEDQMRGLELGADDYILKPFNEDIVRLRIGNQLKVINQMRTMFEMQLAERSIRSDMPLIFFKCRKCKREFINFQEAINCEDSHPHPVSIRNVQYTVKRWPYQVEVTFNDGSKRLYNAVDLSG